ncbi:MAG: hypothetical protein ABNH00_06205 [Dokdonia sp.]|jgi:hypothetical protein
METKYLRIRTILLVPLTFLFMQCAVVKREDELLKGKYISKNGDFFEFEKQTFTYIGINESFYDGNSSGYWRVENDSFLILNSTNTINRQYGLSNGMVVKEDKIGDNKILFEIDPSLFHELSREQVKIAIDVYVHNKDSKQFTYVINNPKSYMCLNLNQFETVSLRVRVYSELLFFGEMAFSNCLFFEYKSTVSGSNYFYISLPDIDTDLLEYIFFNEEFVKYEGDVIYWNGREYRKQ